MTSTNSVLESEAYNYRLYKDFNFVKATFNGEPVGNGGEYYFDTSADKATFKAGIHDAYQVTNDGLTMFYCGLGSAAVSGRLNFGLMNRGSGGRYFAIADMKQGQIIVTEQNSIASTIYSDNCEDISDEIHEAQKLIDADEDGEPDGQSDSYFYWRMKEDGILQVAMGRNAYIMGLQIWIDASAKEAVSSPIMTLAEVLYAERSIAFTPGESTFGSECTTWWGIAEGDEPEEALFLVDSDEIDHYEDVLDENGEVVESIPVYKKVIDPDAWADGVYGEHLFDPNTGNVLIESTWDADGDGFVTIQAATVSETGAFSDIVTLKVSVGEITLNAPTFTLVAMDGTLRTYKMEWVNNTLCGEEVTFSIKNGEGTELTPEDSFVGALITSEVSVEATVSVEGYNSNTGSQDVLDAGVNYYRKNAEQDHDWDFVNLSAEQQTLIKGEMVDYYYLEDEAGNITKYTEAEYESGVGNDGADLTGTNVQIAYVASGWSWDSAHSRASRIPVIANTLYAEDGETVTGYEYDGYEEDKANIYNNGFSVTGAEPYTGSNGSPGSSQMIIIDGYDGLYLSSRATLNFSEDAVKYGEYIVISQLNSTYNDGPHYTTCTMVDQASGFSMATSGQRTRIFYIDIYTRDDLPEVPEELVAIEGVSSASATAVAYYTLSGTKVAAPQKGINIVKYSNGQVKKVLVK